MQSTKARYARAKLPAAALAAALAIGIPAASCGGPAAIAPSAAQEAKIAALAAGIDGTSFASRLALFSNERNALSSPAELASVESSVEAELLAWGYAVDRIPVTVQWIWNNSKRDWFQGPFTMHTIIAEKAGADPDLRPVLLAAHHDTVVGAPGADDNGSGCAALMEVAHALRAESFDRTVRFALFAFEEEGLVGSAAYAASLPEARLPDAVIVLETIGFTAPEQATIPVAAQLLSMPSAGNFIGVFGSRASRALVLDFLGAASRDGAGLPAYALSVDGGLGSDPFLRDLMRSDHAPFWARGVPALMVTDTANLRVGNHYHQAGDTAANVDAAFAGRVTRAALSCLCVRAGLR